MKSYLVIAMIFAIQIISSGQSLTIKVAGECGMCSDRIEEVAKSTIGVEQAVYNLESKELIVKYMEGLFQEADLHNNLAGAGHDTNKAKASKEVYEALPACCQYRVVEEGGLLGMIVEMDEQGKTSPLIGANVYWMETIIGTITDMDGGFVLPMSTETNQLVVSYVGYRADTVEVNKPGHIEVILSNSVQLKTIEVVYRNTGSELSFVNPLKVKKINRKELTKAACCNLSESFETNPSVDVSFTDAVTGTRQIEMLGLAGPYIQITREGMPDVRGLASLDGFTFIPGPWVEGIQMNLGTGSVINGFESVAGQINVELKKPHDEEKLHLNAYVNEGGRVETNAITSFDVSEKIRTNILFHASTRQAHMDRNNDGFFDNPRTKALIFSNRWRYEGGDGHEGQWGFKTTLSSLGGGTIHSEHPEHTWLMNSNVTRNEVWLKRGYVFSSDAYKSLGFILSGMNHNLKSEYGSVPYNGDQKMLYANLLFTANIGQTDHKFTSGFSYQLEKIDEEFSDIRSERLESVPGVFLEYAYSIYEKFDVVAGIRGDYHNNFGFFATPRLHLRYAPSEHHVFRTILGRGQRTANIFAENIKAMATSREWIIQNNETNTPYGLDPEVAWNYGVNYTFLNNIAERPMSIGLDYYYTHFTNQIVLDYDADPQQVIVSNLNGQSYSHSIQFQADFTPIDRLDFRLAYRYNDVQTTFGAGRLQKPLVSRHRSFANVAYETTNGWKFDYTVNLIGSKRIPSTATNPVGFRMADESPSFWTHNAQISKLIGDKFEVYVGMENMANFRQDNAILSADQPNGPYFDASLIWGPIMGRNTYLGFRYILLRE